MHVYIHINEDTICTAFDKNSYIKVMERGFNRPRQKSAGSWLFFQPGFY